MYFTIIQVIDGKLTSSKHLGIVKPGVIDWRGDGLVLVDYSALRYAHQKPDDLSAGDSVKVGDFQLLLLERNWLMRGFEAMLDTPEAHRLFMWRLGYRAEMWTRFQLLHLLELLSLPYNEYIEINDRLMREA